MLTDILPTGYEVGVLNGQVEPGDIVAVVGAGPIGLSAISTARLFSPAEVVAIDLADSRLDAAKRFGADVTINNSREDAVARVRQPTEGLGADVAVEPSAYLRRSSCARGSSGRAGGSPISASTDIQPCCTSKTCGSGT